MATRRVAIPMPGGTESLKLAVAAGLQHDVIARALRDYGHYLDPETRARVEADLMLKAPRRH